MLQRRQWVLGAASVGVTPLVSGCSSPEYEQAARSLWHIADLAAASVGLAGRRPDLVVRFGRRPKLPPSLRRPVVAVLV